MPILQHLAHTALQTLFGKRRGERECDRNLSEMAPCVRNRHGKGLIRGVHDGNLCGRHISACHEMSRLRQHIGKAFEVGRYQSDAVIGSCKCGLRQNTVLRLTHAIDQHIIRIGGKDIEKGQRLFPGICRMAVGILLVPITENTEVFPAAQKRGIGKNIVRRNRGLGKQFTERVNVLTAI